MLSFAGTAAACGVALRVSREYAHSLRSLGTNPHADEARETDTA